MSNISFTPDGTQTLHDDLDTNKATDPANVSAWVLKHCSTEIAPILSVLFTQSLTSGQISNEWLTANVTLVFKKGSQSTPSNYRLISLVAICCKIMEHVLCHNIMNHLEQHNILNQHQYGFRPSHSCQAQLISFVEEIQQVLDHHHQIDLVMLDFSKAFDTVLHQWLLKKLNFFGIRGPIHNWI